MPSALPILGQPPGPTPDPTKIRIGVSSCLLGREVRYDGGHKRNSFLNDTLGRFVDFVFLHHRRRVAERAGRGGPGR